MEINIADLLADKLVKPKQKTEMLSELILEGKMTVSSMIKEAEKMKDPAKATCIEAIEFATQKNADLAKEDCLKFMSDSLTHKAPRIKWESAKVIGNIAHKHSNKLDEAISNLLKNTQHEGTVVRWSAAFALGEIVKLKNKQHQGLVPELEKICEAEEKNSIKKIYLSAFKKLI